MIYVEPHQVKDARNDGRVHTPAKWNTNRANCGAGYNWATDIKFSLEADEVTCDSCSETES